jgi:hypothetical protein
MSPFKAFSPFRKAGTLANGTFAWAGLLSAVQGAERALPALASQAPSAVAVVAGLQDLLKMLRLRAMGLSLAALPASQRDARRELVQQAMALTPQGRATVVTHCRDTRQAFDALHARLAGRGTWHLPVPAWFETYAPELLNLASQNASVMAQYLGDHDCGKPFCLVYDTDRRPHFPGHSEASAAIWLEMGGSERVGRLIRQDMDLHTLKAEEVEAFASREDAGLLLLAGVASLHANAKDFGGSESDSFKIKMKRLTARGQKICDILFRKINDVR